MNLRFWSMMLMAAALLATGVCLVNAVPDPTVVELCSTDGGETFEECP